MKTGPNRAGTPTRGDDVPDAVVIGAGHNGLVAANLLADAGWDVVVCEATPHLGGAVRSAEVTTPGYLSDLFSAFYPLAAASPVINALDLDKHGLSWTHAPAVVTHVFPDDSSARLSRDVQATAASVDKFAAGDGDAWIRMHEEWEQIRQPVLDALLHPLPALMPVQRLARTLGVAGALRMARLAALPVRRFGEERFNGVGGPMLLAGNALHADLPPDGAGSAVYGWLLAMLGQSYGFPVPVGGAGRLTESLGNRLRSIGGSVRFESPVESILIEGGRASGVRLRGGEVIRARQAVLADVTAPILFRELVGESRLPARFVADLRNFQWDLPTLKIDWALRTPVPWTAAEAAGAGTVHLGVDLDGLTDYAADLATRRVPDRPFLLFGQMTTSDPSRSPEGTESAWAYTHLPPGVEHTDEMVADHVALVERTLERHAPGFGDRVVGRYVQSPGKIEEEDPSLVGGTVNGGTAQLHQQLIFRPVPGLGGASTPIDRLFLAGSSAHPGGGVHGAPGSNAAHAALARAGALGGARRYLTRTALSRIYGPDRSTAMPAVPAVPDTAEVDATRR
ncbi:phytoene desaturase family protein [Jatrophihabitans lederbergiae]|uniref:Pyridine nucleotide-disulfide oxidoreductase domain-containing protein 2 n=1 Tax=Jatrophihabitans lederbergiae TaxID=3075547 RepID=A0ABU2JC22_9ACTN|nr:NAD(P)/FAD-dependent oxidoreductase [Jatrophihabitans sp. DSM 44399]MDT0262540.1 NAD(P)/FAD-dependent oxidoreductase [Jatrophihabitans sp. DSM 44399]